MLVGQCHYRSTGYLATRDDALATTGIMYTWELGTRRNSHDNLWHAFVTWVSNMRPCTDVKISYRICQTRNFPLSVNDEQDWSAGNLWKFGLESLSFSFLVHWPPDNHGSKNNARLVHCCTEKTKRSRWHVSSFILFKFISKHVFGNSVLFDAFHLFSMRDSVFPTPPYGGYAKFSRNAVW